MSRFGRLEGLTILGTGRSLPERRVENADLVGASAEITPEALYRLSGVQARYWCHPIGSPASHDEPTSLDLAIAAGREALAESGLGPDRIEGLVVVTTTAPYASVNTGNHVAKALGVKGFALELKAGCAGGVYGLVTAASLMAMGTERILLIAAEAWSKLTPPGLPGPMAVAGDGAGAVVLGQGNGAFLGGSLMTDPTLASAMMPPGQYPPTPDAIARGDYQLRISEDVAEQVRDFYPRVYAEALVAAGLEASEVERVIPHQASGPIVRRALRDCGVSPEQAFHTLERYGNASSASVLMSLHDARHEGVVKPGDRVGLVAVGGGLGAAAALLRL